MGASLPQGKLPNTHYRVSAKAVIVRDDGLVLCVKEGGDNYWNLPGGGIDFGENLQEALSRELHEEVGFSGDFSLYARWLRSSVLLRHKNKRRFYREIRG